MRLTYRAPLEGTGYADWLRELRGKSGCYVIRARDTHKVYYVGESHTGRLYDTITRHFQAWTGKTAGVRYIARNVEVAALTYRSPEKAKNAQWILITNLRPCDNTQRGTTVEVSDVPF